MSQSPNRSAAVSLFSQEDARDVVSDTRISDSFSFSSLPSHWSHPSDEADIVHIFESEKTHIPPSDYLRRCRDGSIDIIARQDCISWILKVNSFYRFKPVTALLCVNYLDRFLSINSLPQPNRWPFQLLSVACLSLAAKMEEPEVPLLLGLQIFEPKFVFEPKTVQRMELWVMANLHWRLRSITPYDFLHFFISNLPSSSSSSGGDLAADIFSASSDLILRTTRAIDFIGFTPSTVAAAAVLSAAGKTVNLTTQESSFPAFHEMLNHEMVRSCHQLMEEYLVDTCPSSLRKVRRPEPVAPPSPVGVLDAAACESCGTRSDNPGCSTRSDNPGCSSQSEPPAKRHRSSPV